MAELDVKTQTPWPLSTRCCHLLTDMSLGHQTLDVTTATSPAATTAWEFHLLFLPAPHPNYHGSVSPLPASPVLSWIRTARGS